MLHRAGTVVRVGTSAEVDRYIAALEHPLKPGIVRLRLAILASDEAITEHVKWNAPSFCYDGVDRVTFRLHPGARFQLIFHRGAKARPADPGLTFSDPSGLMTWPAPDRAVVDLPDLEAVATHEEQVIALVGRWIRT